MVLDAIPHRGDREAGGYLSSVHRLDFLRSSQRLADETYTVEVDGAAMARLPQATILFPISDDLFWHYNGVHQR